MKRPPLSAPEELHLPTAMVDMLSILMIVLLMGAKVTGVAVHGIDPGDSAAKKASVTGNSLRIDVKADGKVLVQGSETQIVGLADRIAAEPDQKRPILLSLETDRDGRGATQNYVQLQVDLGRAKLWNRVKLLTRNEPTKAGAERTQR